MPAPQGGVGQSWFVLDFEAAYDGEHEPWTVLTLDTTAPEVTFGAVGGAEAGSLLQVAYELDTPSITAATITLPNDAQVYPVVVLADRLEFQLPVGTEDGLAVLRVYTLDDVGNEAVWTLPVQVGEATAQPEPVPSRGGLPQAAQREPPRIIELRTRVRIRSWSSVRGAAIARSTAALSSRTLTGTAVRATVPLPVKVSYSSRAITAGGAGTGAMGAATAVIERRNEGPGYEEELIVSGLL